MCAWKRVSERTEASARARLSFERARISRRKMRWDGCQMEKLPERITSQTSCESHGHPTHSYLFDLDYHLVPWKLHVLVGQATSLNSLLLPADIIIQSSRVQAHHPLSPVHTQALHHSHPLSYHCIFFHYLWWGFPFTVPSIKLLSWS